MKTFEKLNTGMINTPIHKLDNISRDLECNIYIKRDDLTGYAFGGNKLRKLDYLLADALNKNCDTLLTYGGPQTNHGRLTAAVAARFGLKCIIIMDGDKPAKPTANLILDKMMNADLYFLNDTQYRGQEDFEQIYHNLKEEKTNEVLKEYEALGHVVYVIPVGGSSTLGALGYFDASAEINQQVKSMGINLDYLVVAFGSAGTYAGLLLGKKQLGLDYGVIGISVSHKSDEMIQKDIRYMNDISQEFDLGIRISSDDVWIENGFVQNGYNIPDKETRQCIYYVARQEAIILDPCYTGKAFNGMMNLIQTGAILKGSNILFLHTGGTPGIFSENHLSEFQAELWD
ncbi:MAG: D-cysteine desulfhydrase family protein [Eubacteriales bacterium]|nr:D-cysteine desulfhydrase family protein [Eubacteriales bacterium]